MDAVCKALVLRVRGTSPSRFCSDDNVAAVPVPAVTEDAEAGVLVGDVLASPFKPLVNASREPRVLAAGLAAVCSTSHSCSAVRGVQQGTFCSASTAQRIQAAVEVADEARERLEEEEGRDDSDGRRNDGCADILILLLVIEIELLELDGGALVDHGIGPASASASSCSRAPVPRSGARDCPPTEEEDEEMDIAFLGCVNGLERPVEAAFAGVADLLVDIEDEDVEGDDIDDGFVNALEDVDEALCCCCCGCAEGLYSLADTNLAFTFDDTASSSPPTSSFRAPSLSSSISIRE